MFKRALVAGAAALLTGCVAVPAGYYGYPYAGAYGPYGPYDSTYGYAYPGYYYAPYYPAYSSINIGFWGGGCCYWGHGGYWGHGYYHGHGGYWHGCGGGWHGGGGSGWHGGGGGSRH